MSLDTVRRDILALETAGRAHRVRGGAVPVAEPAGPLRARLFERTQTYQPLVDRALGLLDTSATLILDGGATVLALAERLRPAPGRLVITPSPWVAIACQQNGIEVFMIGGNLSTSGGVNTGAIATSGLSELAADIAVLGACGLDPEFGLSSDEFSETGLKVAMHAASARTLVLTDRSKIGRRARHRTLHPDQIDMLVTDADSTETKGFLARGIEVHHA